MNEYEALARTLGCATRVCPGLRTQLEDYVDDANKYAFKYGSFSLVHFLILLDFGAEVTLMIEVTLVSGVLV